MATNEQAQQPPSLPSLQPAMPPITEPQSSVMSAPTEDPMDAFAHLSMEPSLPLDASEPMKEPASEPVVPTSVPEVKKPSGRKYKEKQVVVYKSNGKFSKAEIEKVHLDDELEPFYTIKLEFGKEKQTVSFY